MPELALTQFAWLSDIFPPNGLDRSLHAPVLVGLCVLTLFRETLGWSYSGLVVPGYLAAVCIVAPVTGALVASESLLAYLLAALIGRWLPKTGAWSTHFGRERFLLLVVCAILVRLVAEASLLPWLAAQYEFAHSRQLYSIGLVLVPLLANSYWNAGVVAALPRVTVVTAITYLFVDQVLLEFTNFTVSRFQVANENVSLAFLQAPHAYIILIVGAVIAARDNIRYGWDYNGILVPALLAVACYQPTKLVTTVLEALMILFVSRVVVAAPPFSRILMVGSRRMLLCFGLGFVSKWLIGAVMYIVAPDVQMVDLFGFGYLLPSLLAVKMWNTSRIAATLMPTLQVALVAFVVGNLLGAAMRYLEGSSPAAGKLARVEMVSVPVAVRLLLADSAPAPESAPVRFGATSPHQQALSLLKEFGSGSLSQAGLSSGWHPPLNVQQHAARWWTLTPTASDPDEDRIAPRVAVRMQPKAGNSWLVIAEANRVAAPSIVVGFGMAETLGARVFGLRSRLEQVRAFDDAMFRELAQLYELDRVLVLRESTGSLPTLSVVGSIPPGLNLGGLRDQLRSEIKVTWRALSESKDIYDNAAYLELPRVALEHRAAVALGDPGIVHWEEQLEPALARRVVELTEVLPGRFRQPSIEQLRVFGQAVFPGFVDLDRSGTEPGPWQRALAAQLGYRFAKLAKGSAWALHEPASKARQGNATFMLRTGASDRRAPLLVEVPAPRWEAGAVDAAIAVGRAVDSQALLIAGSMPSVDAKGRADVRRVRGARSYYQHAHEIWIQQGGRAVALHGVSPARPTASDVVATFGDPTQTPFAGPSWTRPIVRALVNNGLSVVSVDGSYETEAFEGSTNPAFAFAKRFGDRQMMLLWMTSEARARFLKIRPDEVTEGRVNRLRQLEGLPETLGHAQAMASCLGLAQSAMPGASRDSCSSATGTRVCDSENVVRRLLAYNGTRNPYQLTAALSQPACRVDITRDTRSQRIWALVTGPAALELVPLRTGATARAARGLSDLTEIRQALALGLSTVRIGGGP